MDNLSFALLSFILGHRHPTHLDFLNEAFQEEVARRKEEAFKTDAQTAPESEGIVPDPALLVDDTSGSNTPSMESPQAATKPGLSPPDPQIPTATKTRISAPDSIPEKDKQSKKEDK